jgi:hypothetical protein
MKRCAILLCVVAFGCSDPVPESSPNSHGTVILASGFTIEAPTDSAWSQKADGAQVTFGKTTDALAATLVASSFQADPFLDNEAFLVFAETRQEAAVSDLELVSVHYNRTRLGGTTCLQYDGIYRDERDADSESEYLSIKGYKCRHPTIAGRVVQLEFAQRSASRDPPGTEDVLATANAFFTSVVFTGEGT